MSEKLEAAIRQFEAALVRDPAGSAIGIVDILLAAERERIFTIVYSACASLSEAQRIVDAIRGKK